VKTLNTLSGDLEITSVNSSVVITQPTPNTINLAVGGSAGVTSLQSLTGAVTLQSDDNSISFNNPSGEILDLVVNFPTPPATVESLNAVTGAVVLLADGNISINPNEGNHTVTLSVPFGVDSLNGLQNTLSLTSPDASITITPQSGPGTIELVANFPEPPLAVNALNTLTGNVTLGSDDGSIAIALLPGNIVDLAVNFPDPPVSVTTLNTVSGTVSLTSPDASITITPSGQNIQLQAVVPPPPVSVTTLNTVSGTVSLTSPDASITITPSGQNIQLQAVAPVQPFDTEGLQNKVGIFPVTPATTTTLLASGQITPTSYVPDGAIPTSSTTPEGTPCWLYTKPPALTGFNYYPYNPRFSVPSAPLPYRKANTGTRLKTLWALIQPTVNIYTSGVIALNVYTYDDANPPTSGFYNTRWAYSNTAGAVAGTSGVNLFANYTYLVYAYDAPRTTNTLGVGQPDNQLWGLRDPYDIYTGVHHIPLQNVVVAFNPTATPATNYITWNSTTAFTVGQTVVYSGTTVNPNGLFYTCILNNTNQPPVTAAGVAQTTYWTAISPQPSTYASAPILAININGISGTTGTWTTGPMLRVLSMGYSVGPSPTSTTASYEYVLN